MNNWQEMIADEMKKHGEGLDDLIENTLTAEEMAIKFDSGYGGAEGVSFTAWSNNRVYFPICYDGAEWVGSAPRNPSDEKTEHMGGG